MSRKNTLNYVVSSNHSLAANFTSNPTVITYLDNIAYQIIVRTTNSTGTFSVQGSLDYATGPIGGATNAGNWVDLTLSGIPNVSAANDDILINLNQVPFTALRISYTAGTAGTGHCDIILNAKQVGA